MPRAAARAAHTRAGVHLCVWQAVRACARVWTLRVRVPCLCVCVNEQTSPFKNSVSFAAEVNREPQDFPQYPLVPAPHAQPLSPRTAPPPPWCEHYEEPGPTRAATITQRPQFRQGPLLVLHVLCVWTVSHTVNPPLWHHAGQSHCPENVCVPPLHPLLLSPWCPRCPHSLPSAAFPERPGAGATQCAAASDWLPPGSVQAGSSRPSRVGGLLCF